MFHPFDDHPGHPRGARGHYDPHQPRVPPGHPDGGQWTSGDGWALSDLAELPAPDLRAPEIPGIRPGTYPQYAFAGMQLPRYRPRPQPNTTPSPAPPTPPTQPSGWLGKRLAEAGILIGLGLTWLQQLSSDDSDNEHVVVGVRREFRRRSDSGPVQIDSERKLSQEEVEKYCPDIKVIQGILNLARDNIGHPDDYISNDKGGYGKAVHKEFNKLLKKVNINRLKNGDPEIFLINETFSWNGEEKDRKPTSEGAKTPDALQRRGVNACVYEVTTGKGINRDRMLAIVHNLAKDDSMKGIMNFIITRVRPSTPLQPRARMR